MITLLTIVALGSLLSTVCVALASLLFTAGRYLPGWIEWADNLTLDVRIERSVCVCIVGIIPLVVACFSFAPVS